MTQPKTYVDAIEQVRKLRSMNLTAATRMSAILSEKRYSSSELEAVDALRELFQANVDYLQDISTGIAELGMANSNEDFSKILAALAK